MTEEPMSAFLSWQWSSNKKKEKRRGKEGGFSWF
jgi:hypothetical protein